MTQPASAHAELSRRHLVFGWWSLAFFAAVGLVLESFHGFKVGAYLDVSNDTRRLMWTLAHAHGTLVSFVHIALALVARAGTDMRWSNPSAVSRALVGASVLLPGGFFLGGVQFYGGDPGVGIILVPVGALLLLYAVVSVARVVGAPPEGGAEARPSRQKPK